MRKRLFAPTAALALAVSLAGGRATARPDAPPVADKTHVVSPGNTLQSIARRYKISVEALREANDLPVGAKIRLGQRLVVPPPEAAGGGGARTSDLAPHERASGKHGRDEIEGGTGRDRRGDPPDHAARHANDGPGAAQFARVPKHPGVARLSRGGAPASVRLVDRRGHVVPAAIEAMGKLLRAPSGARHAIDPRLVALVALVSDHFGGREIRVVSGFRPFSPSQFTAHSNHNLGRAMDFVIEGVPNEVVRDYCRTLRNVGVGYYPNSSFVHMDVRGSRAYWVDYAKAGERPKYDRPDAPAEADEGAGEVGRDDAEPPSTPNEAPAASPPEAAPGTPVPAGGSQDTHYDDTANN